MQQDLGGQDPDPPAAADEQSRNCEDDGVCTPCGLWDPDTGWAGAIDWVQCDTCQQWLKDACVGWEEATGDFLCRDCEQGGNRGPLELSLRKHDRTWVVEKRTSPSKN